MNKHRISGIWHKIGDVSLVGLIITFMIFAGVSIFALRSNNLRMTELRQAVYIADENDGDVELALRELRTFVYAHMNTDLRAGSSSSQPPIQLVNRFERAVASEQARVAAQNNATQVYADAQARCEKSSIPLTARAQCIQDYVAQNGNGIPQLSLPPKEFYTFDFASPFWSPDIAGWSLVATVFVGLLIIARLLAGLVVKLYVRH